MARWFWYLREIAGRLWVRATLYGILAIITALVSIYVRRFVPSDISEKIGANAVDELLHILANSMLAVTIFSVSTMVSAYSAATNNVTPRATKLLIEDKISHNALSTFIGTFIFSIVGIIALQTGVYGVAGRLVLFIVTVIVIAIIVVTLVRWIGYLSSLGRVSETVERIEEAATEAMLQRLRLPWLGGVPLESAKDIPANAVPVKPDSIGYIQYIDVGSLEHIAEKQGGTIYIQALPGKFIDPATPLAFVSGIDAGDVLNAIRMSFIMGPERSYRQDPRFGMAVLSEIASRALSPAINDPGTALHVVGVGMRVLALWATRNDKAPPNGAITYKRVHVPGLSIDDLFDDFFFPIERDGAAVMEVMLRLQKVLSALCATGNPDLRRAALHHSALSLERSLPLLALQEEKDRLKAAAPKAA
jgi:uncharacterized membrane protein